MREVAEAARIRAPREGRGRACDEDRHRKQTNYRAHIGFPVIV